MQDLATEHVPNNERDPGLDELQVGGGPFEREAIEICPAATTPSHALDQKSRRAGCFMRRDIEAVGDN